MLCTGLDTVFSKIPAKYQALASGSFELGGHRFTGCAAAVLAFNRDIIDQTAAFSVAYKPNLAFYECLGYEGLHAMEATVDYIRANYPDQFLIADAKRGDIGNTAKMYARTYFEAMDFDAVTVAPYMGTESVEPFLGYPGKFAIVVALSSNPSSADFQTRENTDMPLYEVVMRRMMEISTPENLMFVVGATKAAKLREIREFCPDNFFLVPGVGAQGGSAEEVIANGANSLGGLLINSSRGIIYADSPADAAAHTARFGL